MRSNPNGARLNLSQDWRSKICVNSYYGSYVSKTSLFGFWVAKRFRRSQERSNNGLIFNSVKILYFSGNHVRFKFYFYDGFLQDKLFNYRHARRARRRYKWVGKRGQRKRKVWLRRRKWFGTIKRRKKSCLFFGGRRYRRLLQIDVNVRRFVKIWGKIFRRRRFLNIIKGYARRRWNAIFTLIATTAQKIFKNFFVSVSAHMGERRGIHSPMVARYVVGSLVNRFDMVGTVYRMIRGMIRNWFTPGIKVTCSGRFTRRQRKTYRKFQMGKVAIYKFDYNVEYFLAYVRQKYGTCGIKVWLAHYYERIFEHVRFVVRYRKQITYFRKRNVKIYQKYKKNSNKLEWIKMRFVINYNFIIPVKNHKLLFFDENFHQRKEVKER